MQTIGFINYGISPKGDQKEQIVPTEFDYYYRSQLLQGDVHDMGAAMFGGVAGHAGFFLTPIICFACI